jgi:hypothetical protein
MEVFMVQAPVKRLFVGIIAVSVALVFVSCYSYPLKAENYAKNIVYWDEDLPREESVELLLAQDGLTVTSYNGIAVDWGKKPLVFLPPGPTVFTVELTNLDTGYTLLSGNSIFAWDFKAGDRFNLRGWARDGKYGILLWDMQVKKDFADMDFFPFPEPEKTVLE